VNTQEPVSPRQLVASIVLSTGLPLPQGIDLGSDDGGPYVMLRCASIDDAVVWAETLGVPVTTAVHDGRRMLTAEQVPTWHGWRVYLSAVEPVSEPVAPLDADTTAQLRDLVGDDTPGGAS
jgi:hypothetical protein